jgi:hypothetical protein
MKFRNDTRIEEIHKSAEKTPLGIVPLSTEFRDSVNKNLLNGDQAYIRSGHRPVVIAVREFEQNNPQYSGHVFDENGDFEDKDFVKDGYEKYLALSHLHELQPYVAKLEPVANHIIADLTKLQENNPYPEYPIRIPNKEEALLPFLAQVYIAKESHMVPDRLDFMVKYEAEHPSISSSRMNLMREAFLGGQTIPDVEKYIGKPFPVAEAIRDSKAYSTPEQYEVLLTANDANVIRQLSIAFEFDKLPADVGQAIIDFNNKLDANPELKAQLPFWFRNDGKVDVFLNLSHSHKINADEVRRLGDCVLNTGKELSYESAAARLNAFRGINQGKDEERKIWRPKESKSEKKVEKETVER